MGMLRGTWAAVLGASAVLVGCNWVTGADDISLAGPAEESSSDDAAATSGGHETSTVATGTGGAMTSGSGGGPVEEPPPLGLVDGVSLTGLDLYQGLRRPLVEAGAAVSDDLPIVAGRIATLRVFYATDPSYNGQSVTVRLFIDDAPPVELAAVLHGVSSHGDLDSTVNLEVPGELLKVGAQYRVELSQPLEQTSNSNMAAAFPASLDERAPLEVEQGGKKLKLLLVPVQYGGELPDTSPSQIDRYHAYFSEQYPVPEIEISVRPEPYPFSGNLGSGNGWSYLLDEITDLRQVDGSADDVYYYGIHTADAGGLLGLGWIGGPDDVWSRSAIGVGWSGDTSPETAVHEIGHNHGRDHAPCGVSGDPNFPHAGASIGVWGYVRSSKTLLDPNDFVDLMSYCHPAWISDYNYKAIFQRIKQVDQSPYISYPADMLDQTWERVKVIDGAVSWEEARTLPRPPVGEARSVTVTSAQGEQQVTGHFYRYDHLDGGVMYVKRSGALASKVQFTLGGQALVAER